MAYAEHAKPLNGHGGNRQGSNSYVDDRGSEYLTARIARDRPDILDGMKAGKFRSVRSSTVNTTARGDDPTPQSKSARRGTGARLHSALVGHT